MINALSKIWNPLVLFIAVCAAIWNIDDIITLLHLPVEWHQTAIQIFSIIAWIIGALLFVRLTRIIFWEGLVERTVKRPPPRLIVQLGNVFIIFLAFSGVLVFVFNQSITAFWTASGAVGIVIGFALRNLILDTFSGLAIHMERPFKVGQWINVHTRFGEYKGRVEETNWRTTRLWTTGRNIIIIPNSFITTTILSNYSMGGMGEVSRFELVFTLDYSVPTDRAIRVLTAAVQASIGSKGPLPNPAPKVRSSGVTPFGIEYKMRYYIDPDHVTTAKARNTIINNVMEHLNHAGLTLSYPKRDVYMTQMPWRQKSWQYPKDQVTQIKKLSLFEALELEDLEFIAEKMRIHHYRKLDTVVSQGDDGNSMFILAEGLLEVLIEQEDNTSFKVADLAPGTFFGEKSLLTGEPRSATIICATDVVVCEITKSAMSDLFARNEDVAALLSKAVALRDLENQSAIANRPEDNNEEALAKETDLFLGKLKSFFGLKG
ncbi:mechanosensitive ion channel family protein [Terasakiella sp. A23]|uniref:mechanosensitive ion channel family protein n=1 Tax=Terasakiella sp. FCG-A23 TaxID=3080561 RepID=UPI00295596D4|nr:mechanosensitive ion channel family protein [Terasakiella sp. A23]MDV7341401.1 mechanosensitive ion channel family protein [Terasakiella sp. A23]